MTVKHSIGDACRGMLAIGVREAVHRVTFDVAFVTTDADDVPACGCLVAPMGHLQRPAVAVRHPGPDQF